MMKYGFPLVSCCLVILSFCTAGWTAEVVVRPPIGIDGWYPTKPDELKKNVDTLLETAKADVAPGKVWGCIVPHAAYDFSGETDAAAFKQLKKGDYDRVIILAPSHIGAIQGCSIPKVEYYNTPLGDVALDGPAIRKLLLSSLFNLRVLDYSKKSKRPPIHEAEHGIEVLLPFLQEQLGGFKLVPIIIGELNNGEDKIDRAAIAVAADAIRSIMDDRTLLVVSSDFTHYGEPYRYTPFAKSKNPLDDIKEMDKVAIDLILGKDLGGFIKHTEKSFSTICGRYPLYVFIQLLPTNTTGHLLRYDMSGTKTGKNNVSVSYAALTFNLPAAMSDSKKDQ